MTNSKIKSLGLAFVLFFVAGAGTVYGQGGATGTILGTVTDATGAVVAGAKVTVTNSGTAMIRVTETTGAATTRFRTGSRALSSHSRSHRIQQRRSEQYYAPGGSGSSRERDPENRSGHRNGDGDQWRRFARHRTRRKSPSLSPKNRSTSCH